jgi:hypothetical protein
MLIEKLSNEIAFEYNKKKEAGIDIILVLTIGKIIFDIVKVVINCYSSNPNEIYKKYQNVGIIDRRILLSVIRKHYPNRSDIRQIREAILSQKLSQEDVVNLVNEVKNEST